MRESGGEKYWNNRYWSCDFSLSLVGSLQRWGRPASRHAGLFVYSESCASRYHIRGSRPSLCLRGSFSAKCTVVVRCQSIGALILPGRENARPLCPWIDG